MALDKTEKAALITDLRELYGLSDESWDGIFASEQLTVYRSNVNLAGKQNAEKKDKSYLLDDSQESYNTCQTFCLYENTGYIKILCIGSHTLKDSDNLYSEYTGD